MIRSLAAMALLLTPAIGAAQSSPAPSVPPKLVVVIAVDQLSADLFAQYRAHFTGGLKRLAGGVVFPSGYQSHAATETCPGHATILTGVHPARSGVIANNWIDQSIARADKGVYCAEDVTAGASSKASDYVSSPVHLLVPTLGDRMKAANPATRIVSVAGKDRAAIMMAGRASDEIWWLRSTDYAGFATLKDRTGVPTAVARANAAIDRTLAAPARPMALTALCATRSIPVPIGARSIGEGRFARPAGDKRMFRASPEADAAVFTLAGDLAADMKLGRGAATDLLIVGASATDIVGHAYGTEGSEMCLQMAALDRMMGAFFTRLDRSGVDYMVVLTADHGGHDTTERNVMQAILDAQRVSDTLNARTVGAAVARELNYAGRVLVGAEATGDIYLDVALPAALREPALARAKAQFAASPQVAGAFTATEIMATAIPTTPPETWTLIERVRASYLMGRSGDLYVALKPRVLPITVADTARGYVATHGSPWDYDRRVPVVFWRKGLVPFEQPNSVEVTDIAPTLAALLRLPVAPGDYDGVCRDIVAGSASSCPAVR